MPVLTRDILSTTRTKGGVAMEYKRDSSFPVGKYTGSCGKEEAMERALKQQSDQHLNILAVDPQKEEETLSNSLPNRS